MSKKSERDRKYDRRARTSAGDSKDSVAFLLYKIRTLITGISPFKRRILEDNFQSRKKEIHRILLTVGEKLTASIKSNDKDQNP